MPRNANIAVRCVLCAARVVTPHAVVAPPCGRSVMNFTVNTDVVWGGESEGDFEYDRSHECALFHGTFNELQGIAAYEGSNIAFTYARPFCSLPFP